MKPAFNLEFSEMQPRRPPIGHDVQGIARIQPMESSRRTPSDLGKFDTRQNQIPNDHLTVREPLREIVRHAEPHNSSSQGHIRSELVPLVPQPGLNTQYLNFEGQNKLQKQNISITTPEPPKQIRQVCQDNDHDLSLSLASQLFFNTKLPENSSNVDIKATSNSENGTVSKTAPNTCRQQTIANPNESLVSAEVMELLNLQNQEIINAKLEIIHLREQLDQLTKERSGSLRSSGSKPSTNLPPLDTQQSACSSFNKEEKGSALHQTSAFPHKKNANVRSHTSTQISAPSSTAILVKNATCEKSRGNNEDKKESISFVQLEENDPRNEYNLRDPPIIVNNLETAPPILTPLEPSGINCPATGNISATVSHNEHCRMSPDLMNLRPKRNKDIRYIDLCPPEDIRKSINDNKENEIEHNALRQARGPTQDVNVNEPTVLGRVRQMGISFLQPQDLQKSASDFRGDEQAKDYSLMWYPKAAAPSILTDPQKTSNESLLLNSAALRYLNDEQLTTVAKHTHLRREESSKVPKSNMPITPAMIKPTELSMYGIPENELSKSTIEYLEKNHLVREK